MPTFFAPYEKKRGFQRRRRVAAAILGLLLFLIVHPALAQPAKTRSLRWDPALDVSITAGGATVWIVSELLKGDLAPAHCRWCNVDSVDGGVRSALVWGNTSTADALSNVAGFVAMPLAAIGLNAAAAAHDSAFGNVPEDALLVGEAGVIAANLTQLTKMLVGRERPFVHALPADQKLSTAQPSDNNLSFFSGHTSEAFSLAVASGTIATMRGYRWAPVTWSAGASVAAITAYLRIAADKHWLTDVLVGAIVGGGVGFLVPYVFHSPISEPSPSSNAAALRGAPPPATTGFRFAW